MTKPRLFLTAVSLWLAVAAPSRAAVSESWLSARTSLTRCLAEADAKTRGACLEQAARALDAADARGEGPLPTAAQQSAHAARTYGLRGERLERAEAAPRAPRAAKAPREPRVSHDLVTEIASAVATDEGDWVMTTREGAVWAQTDHSYLSHPPHAGSSLVVRPAALGSYFCLIDNRREVRCRRRS